MSGFVIEPENIAEQEQTATVAVPKPIAVVDPWPEPRPIAPTGGWEALAAALAREGR